MGDDGKWIEYESRIYALFKKHFGEHEEVFAIKSLRKALADDQARRDAAENLYNIEKAISKIASKLNESIGELEKLFEPGGATSQRSVVQELSDLIETATLEGNEWIPIGTEDQGIYKPFGAGSIDNIDQDDLSVVSYRAKKVRNAYIYTEPYPDAICIPDQQATTMATKLTQSSKILQRYVGGYIAAVIEMLVDGYFEVGQEGTVKIHSEVLNLEWKCLTGGVNFFYGLANDFLNFLWSGLPAKFSGKQGWIDTAKTGSQFQSTGQFIDYHITPKNADVEETITLSTDSQRTTKITQTYRLMTIFVEIKVLTADDNSLKSHTQRAIQNIEALPGTAALLLQPRQEQVSTCFCLSHAVDDTTASTATTLAVREGSAGTVKEYQWPPFAVGAAVEGLFPNGTWYPATVARVDGANYVLNWDDGDTQHETQPAANVRAGDPRPVPFVQYESLTHKDAEGKAVTLKPVPGGIQIDDGSEIWTTEDSVLLK